ncbi:unnamed protein product, partial [Cylicocyclus nassatus]
HEVAICTEEYSRETQQCDNFECASHRKRGEGDVELRSRLATDASRAALRRYNETKHEQELRLASSAERSRLKRSAENEKEKGERLASAAKRARTRRLASSERQELSHATQNHLQLPYPNENESVVREEASFR